MRKILLLPLLLGAQLSYAQLSSTPEPSGTSDQSLVSSYTQLVDSLTAPLDKSRVPKGILYDRVPAVALLNEFTQVTPSSASHIFQSYFELRSAAYQSAGFPISRSEFANMARTAATATKVSYGELPIGVLDYQFGVLDTLAEEKGSIITINGLYADGVGNPYQTQQVTIAALLADSVNQKVTLTLPPNFLLGNTQRYVRSVQVTVGGFTRTLTPGGTSAILLPPGLLTASYLITFSDSRTISAKSELYVRPTYLRRDNSVAMPLPNVKGLPWADYKGFSTYGEGQVTCFLYNDNSKVDSKLRKPTIIIDGFDPSDKRGIQEIFTQFSPVGEALYGAKQPRDLIVLNFPTTKRLITYNGSSAYGDTDGGADFIERNAFVLIELLSKIKPLMANPSEKVTIIGPSMGGVISRYALALMEKNYADANNSATYNNAYWKHNVDTWISFDAPHQGANIPLGDQAFIRYFSGLSESAEHNLSRLNSVAARQMLVYQHLNLTTGYSLHEPFTRNLQSNGLAGSYGYPTQVRRVALANGNGTGALNTAMGLPGQTGMELDVARKKGNKRRQFFYRSTTPGTQIAANMYFAGPSNVKTTIFNGEARVLVALAKPIAKRYQVWLTGPRNYDLAPGGTYDAQQQIATGTLNGKQIKGVEFRFTQLRPNHCFIPTVSALGYQYRTLTNYTGISQLPDPNTNLSARNLICNNEIPFDSYYMYTNANGAHVTMDGPAQMFLMRELTGQTQAPRFKVTNPPQVCPNQVAYVSLDECSRLGDVTYTWTLSGPAIFPSTGTTTTTNGGVVQSIRSTGQPGTVMVSVVAKRAGANESPSTTYQLTVIDGGAALQPRIQWDDNQVRICPWTPVAVRAEGNTTGPYYWTKRIVSGSTGAVTTSTYTTTSPSTSVTPRYDEITLSVTAPSTCSGVMLPAGSVEISADPTEGKMCDPYNVQVYPNPSTQYLTVTTLSETESPDQFAAKVAGPEEENPHAYQVDLYNDRSKKVHSASTKKGTITVDTSTLPAGLYHVQIRRGGQIVNRNLSVQH
ncbi:T9SS type A sorting domain-containing protein [Hymenobacter guriensis]|uniref:T9SS type A sorting domain-containing protein n=1 Tax=Hymenobacter guriensis TaxID=2793065 RepID=A0ABS0L4U8_9BACT|nr:T9SS type A sorting domain-containing protein [Hymenobacter guriensis]MBG8555117.1 hypothetical protein [Hymenobacter guriensis]